MGSILTGAILYVIVVLVLSFLSYALMQILDDLKRAP